MGMVMTLILGILGYPATALSVEDETESQEIADTKYGLVQGRTEDGVVVFKGIPYAKAPVGNLRFHSPEEPDEWDGVKQANRFGPICAQMPLMNLAADALLSDYEKECEDCLYLNIWTPKPDNKKRPVMFWIHGGAYFYGSGSQPFYTGDILAKKGDVVVVTFNYRLGILGNLTHPSLKDEKGHYGNWAILDIIQALKWVKENIAAFGGDPDNVTIFGESAGGWSVCSLMISPETWNTEDGERLFHRAIAQSPVIKLRSLEESIVDAEKYFKRVGCPDGDMECLRNASFNKIRYADDMMMEILPPILKPLLYDTPELNRFLDWNVLPVVDGVVIPKTPKEAMAEGWTSDLQMIIGTCQEEVDFLGYAFNMFLPKSMVMKYIESIVSGETPDGTPKAEIMYDAYLEALRDDHVYWPKTKVLGNIITDYFFRIESVKFAEMHKAAGGDVYMYQMAYPLFLDQSLHVTEVPYVFGQLKWPGFAGLLLNFRHYPGAVRLKDAIQDAWISFAHTGVPDITTSSLTLEWPQYDPEDRMTLIFKKKTELVSAPEEKERAVWDEVDAQLYGF